MEAPPAALEPTPALGPVETVALTAPSTPAPAAQPFLAPRPVRTTPSLYWGAWIGSHLTGGEAPWDPNATALFERHAGKRLSLLHFSSPFADSTGSTYYTFPTTPFNAIRQRGSIPFFSWASNASGNPGHPDFALADVIAGRHDSYIGTWATAAKTWGKPFFLRFNWEMNGGWFPWSELSGSNRQGEYVAAWRHVHDVFRSVGATNATWVWCPNIDPYGHLQPLAGLYPGDAYVDWTCLDGYNGNVPWTSFTGLFQSTYGLVTGQIAPSKPMIIGETGSTEVGGSKAQWTSDLFAALPKKFPKIRGLLWFDKVEAGPGGHTDWPIESSLDAQSAFAAGIASPRFVGNTVGGITTSPIPVP